MSSSIKELLLSSNYWVVNKNILQQLGLEATFLLSAMAEADKMLSDENGWFYQTMETLEEITTLKRRKQDKAIELLIKQKILLQKNKGMPMKRFFKINYDVLASKIAENSQPRKHKSDNQECVERTTKGVQNVQTKMCKTYNNKESTYKENNYKESSSANTDIVKEIVNYLNKQAKKEFKTNTKDTVKKINARLRDGFVLEDFKNVIDKKTEQWKNDEKWNGYLRPQTLFGTKFESYLNENFTPKKKNKSEVICESILGEREKEW